MIILYFLLRLSFQQQLNLAASDLQDPLTINGWSVSNNGNVDQHQTTIFKCNQNLLLLNRQPKIYSKTFTIRDYEYDTLYLEMETYFVHFSESTIYIFINSILVFKQKFSTNYMLLNDICGGSDSQYTIYQKFYSQQTQLKLEIQFVAANANSQLGIRNLNIYTNGYKLSNGCNLDSPFLQGTSCVEVCSNNYAYLGGDDMLVCQSGTAGQSSLKAMQLVSQNLDWIFSSLSPSTAENVYLNAGFLINTNIYPNIMNSGLFTDQFNTPFQFYYITYGFQSTHKLQISFLFYILGDWDDGAQVGLYIIGDTNYQNNMVKIFNQLGYYYSSTGSGIYYTKIISQGVTLTIGFSQQLLGTQAKYGFGNIYIYELLNDPKIVLSGLYGLPYKCIANYYAYNGYCVQNCPSFTYKDQTNNNCTDYSSQYSTIFSNTATSNQYGIYIIKEFYNNYFNWDTVKIFFQVSLYPTNNYLNGQPFSFIGNKKILGGYSSWGWGTYGTFINIPEHNQIRVYFNLYLIDNWQAGDTFSYYIDGSLVQTFTQNNPNIQLQGLYYQDQQFKVTYTSIHSQPTISLYFSCNIAQQNSQVASCGISDLFVLIDENTNILCPLQSEYFSYFTNNCEQCLTLGCELYPDNIPAIYQKCTAGCLDCSSNIDCASCDTALGYSINGNTCECLSGYFQLITCNKCHYSCTECTGPAYTDCTSCDSTRTISSGVCSCQTDKFDVFSQSQCELIHDSSSPYCHYSCDTCFGAEYHNCLTCPAGSNRAYKDSYSCKCDTQFIDVGVQACEFVTCHDTCLTCDGPLESNCLSCPNNFRYESGFCICDGLFNNILDAQICIQNDNVCDYSCLTCYDSTLLGCISCNASQNRYLNIDFQTNQSSCQCYDGYFEVAQFCEQCDQTCLTCSTSATHCTSCSSERNREISKQNACVCIDGQNDKLNLGQLCVLNLSICHYSCSQCFGLEQDQCLVCNPTYRALNNTSCDCLASQYDNGQLQCQNCHFTCLNCKGSSMNDCLKCDEQQFRKLTANICQCFDGYQENENGLCKDCKSIQGRDIFSCQYTNAQDGIWTYGEQCDDGNNDPSDGCHNFQITKNYSCTNILNQTSFCYKCPENCLKCQKQQNQIICISCNQQYYNAKSQCIACKEDSCLQCTTPSYCIECINQQLPLQGKCNNCENGYYYGDNQCLSRCGDAIKTIDEQCDDGNTQSRDGCTELCQIESNFVCKTINNSSICFIQEQPYLIYKVQQSISQSNSEQKKIQIWVSQRVTFKNISVEIVDQPTIQIQFTVTGNDRLIIDLKLNFNQSYESITINILVKGEISNQYNQAISNNKIQVTLRNIIILDEQQKQTAQKLSQTGQGVVIGLFCMSTTTIFMVGISQFVSFSNLVQQLQFIQYLNIQFPPHFMQFLDIFNGFKIAPIFEVFTIQKKLTQQDPQQQLFQSNGINAYFIANMQGSLFSSLSVLIFYIQLKFSIYAIQRIKQYLYEKREIIQIKHYANLYKFQLQLQKTCLQIKKEGFNALVFTTCYDIQFAIFLQLNNQSFDSNDLMLNYLLAILTQLLYLKFLGSKIINDEIIDGRWQQLYSQVKLVAALIFQFAVVQLQDFPQCQLLIISSTSLLTSYYLIRKQPFKNILRNYQLIIQEMALCVSNITFIAYLYFPQSVDPVSLGWFHIMTFISMLLGNLVIDLYQFVMNIKRIYFK
ncbi:hypothetical protein pb186bvf_010460 [Paramecium bursaria]